MVDVAWFMNLSVGNKAAEYLKEVATSLEALDSFLWTTRNDSTCFGLTNGTVNSSSCPAKPSPGNTRGLLWSLGAGDSGEDGSQKYGRAATVLSLCCTNMCMLSLFVPNRAADEEAPPFSE